jgi:flagellar motor switch/type III secretory pathway protein FliN
MTNLFEEIGTLEVIVGRGCISSYEIDNLKPTDIVLVSDREAGEPVSVLFNSQLLAHGEIVAADGIFAVRVVKPVWNNAPLPFAGQPDDLMEMLEFRIRLAAVKMRLADLVGVSENSIINLGIETKKENSLELTVVNFAIATGTIWGSSSQQFGLQIEAVSCRTGREFEVFTSGSVANDVSVTRDQDHIFLLDKFTKNQVRAVSIIHERFASNLNAMGADQSDFHCTYVDQVSYANLLDSLDQDIICVLAESTNDIKKGAAHKIKRYIVQNEYMEHQLDNDQKKKLTSKISKLDNVPPLGSFLAFIKGSSSIASNVSDPTYLKDFFTSLRNSWKQKYRMPFLAGTIINEERYKTMFDGTEHMLVAGVGNADGSIVMAYPTIIVSKITNVLGD